MLLTSCLPYPVYKTIQPALEVISRDTNLRPIQSVSISLISKAYPSGGEKSRETNLSDGDGRVIFQEKHEWRTEVLMIHGWEEYFWHLCIQKSGFLKSIVGP